MKTTVCRRPDFRAPIPFPNAMTRKQILEKLLDAAVVAASGMGIAATVLLLLVL